MVQGQVTPVTSIPIKLGIRVMGPGITSGRYGSAVHREDTPYTCERPSGLSLRMMGVAVWLAVG